MAKFIVLMYEDDDAWSRLPAAERDALLGRYYAWAGELKDRGAFHGGDPVAMPGRRLRRLDGQIVEEAYRKRVDLLTGYFLIEAPDLAAASAIAHGCPALLHGETVVVRPVGHV